MNMENNLFVSYGLFVNEAHRVYQVMNVVHLVFYLLPADSSIKDDVHAY